MQPKDRNETCKGQNKLFQNASHLMCFWWSCAVFRASDFGRRGPCLNPGRCTFRCGLERVTFTLLSTGWTQEAVDGRPTWTDCDEAGDYVMPNVLSPRDLVFRPDNMDETLLHTFDVFSNFATGYILTLKTQVVRRVIEFMFKDQISLGHPTGNTN